MHPKEGEPIEWILYPGKKCPMCRIPKAQIRFLAAKRLAAMGYVVESKWDFMARYLTTQSTRFMARSSIDGPTTRFQQIITNCTRPCAWPAKLSTDARQRQTLKLIAKGNANKQIAKMLGLKIKTIEMHRDLLMKKLGNDSIAGLTRFALKHKIID